jgi:succinyl-CoA synthetase beta subunit
MTRLLENHSMDVLSRFGLQVVPYVVSASGEESRNRCAGLKFPVVVKALVPLGGRGKGGVVKFCHTLEESVQATDELVGKVFKHFPIDQVLISSVVNIATEWFLSITYDNDQKCPVVLFTTEGGVDVETILRDSPEKLITRLVDVQLGLRQFEARELCEEADVPKELLNQAAALISNVYKAFVDSDSRMIEINPIIVTNEDKLLIPTGVIVVDERADFRHPEFHNLPGQVDNNGWRPLTKMELQMKEIDESDSSVGHIRFNEFTGDIALMVTGGGAGSIAFDTLLNLEVMPATTFDITNGNIEHKMCAATKLILSKPGLKGLLAGANFANFAPVDNKVRGIVQALKELNIDARKFPIVMRFCGPNQDIAQAHAESIPGVEFYDDNTSIEQAARRIVELIQGREANERSVG